MAGKFVPAGTLDKPTERDNAWLQAEQELEDRRAERERNKAAHDGKTLFEVLQANKAAKEEAFQESIKLKNQFRALNDDEVDFLDSQIDAKRAKEEAIRQETSAQLKLFREKQEAANKLAAASSTDTGKPEEPSADGIDVDWAMSRKRKRIKESVSTRGSKARRNSSEIAPEAVIASGVQPAIQNDKNDKNETTSALSTKPRNTSVPTKSESTKPSLGLVGYGSDDDSD